MKINVPKAQVRDEAGAAHGKAQPRTGQLAGFREGLHHQQVVVPVNERHAALAAKVHIGLVHDDHVVGCLLRSQVQVFFHYSKVMLGTNVLSTQ